MLKAIVESDGRFQFIASIFDEDRGKKYILSACCENMYTPITNSKCTLALVECSVGDMQYFYSTVAVIDLVNAKLLTTMYLGQGQKDIVFAPDDYSFYWGDCRYEISKDEKTSHTMSVSINIIISDN